MHKRTPDILISLVHRDNVVKEVMKRVPYHLTMTKKASRLLYRARVSIYVYVCIELAFRMKAVEQLTGVVNKLYTSGKTRSTNKLIASTFNNQI